ncbi:MAG: hypothetical protein PHY16_19530 [Methylobacter sp.]|nr:hypothetical protein [Methylobacter sp.]
MNALGGSILILVITVVLLGSARWAVMGMMAAMLYLPLGMSIPIFGINMFAIRFVEIAAFVRIIFRREFALFVFNGIDQVFVLLYGYTTLVFLARSSEGQANVIGMAVDAYLCYFAFRALIHDFENFKCFLRTFLLLLGPYAVLVLIETLQGHHVFALLGSYAPEVMRGGRLRSIGSFDHPSLLGTLGASFMPIYIGLWCAGINRIYAFIGIVLCAVIVWASNSGGPISCVAYGILGWILWINRKNMQWFRRGIVAVLCLLALVMNAPIWFLIARLGSITGGDSWHRSQVIDVFIKHIDEWWLSGMPIQATKYWLPNYNYATGGIDLTNYYLGFGLTAGLGAMILFILLLVRGFSHIGNALEVVRNKGESDKSLEFLLWGLGVMLAVHIMNWLGITYYDQTYVLWFMQLAVLATLSDNAIRSSSNIPEVKLDKHASKRTLKRHRYVNSSL